MILRILILASLFFPTLTFGAPATQPAVGDEVSDFAAQTPGGENVLLSSLNSDGPVVLIVLRGWPGYQCPLCTKQVADFLAHAKDFETAKAHVLLVYPGPAEKLKEHADEFVRGKTIPANYTLVIDPDYNLVNAWHLRWDKKGETAYPSTFVIDKSNKVRFAKVSKSHGDRASASSALKAVQDIKD